MGGEKLKSEGKGSRTRTRPVHLLNSSRLSSDLRCGGSLLCFRLGGLGRLLVGHVVKVRGPESEVVPEELHDEGRVLVALLGQCVELGDGVVERSLGQPARLVGAVQDLVVEDGEVEGKSEADGVRRGELSRGDGGRRLV
jgi:hypothetical protein